MNNVHPRTNVAEAQPMIARVHVAVVVTGGPTAIIGIRAEIGKTTRIFRVLTKTRSIGEKLVVAVVQRPGSDTDQVAIPSTPVVVG